MTPTTFRTLGRLALFAALAAVVLVAATPWAQAPAAKPALTGEAAKVKKLLEEKFDGVTIGSVTRSPYLGLYEVMFDDQIVYTDAKVNHVIVGSIYDANTKKNLTEARKRQLARVDFDSLPLELAIKKVKGNGARKIAIFSDADCPYCARLEKELQGIDNVTIYTFLYPIDKLHPDAARKSRIIWCAPDKVKAWDEFFTSGALPANDGECDNPLAATNTLGQKLRINATPTLVFADGSIVPGALPAARLEAEFKQAEAAAAKPVGAKPVAAKK
jgi:thiol:disulfide interchange protein DsbC